MSLLHRCSLSVLHPLILYRWHSYGSNNTDSIFGNALKGYDYHKFEFRNG